MYIIVAEVIEIKKVDFIHESGVAILLGIFVGLIIKYGMGKTIAFDESSLFYFILPPIIFSAGYTLKRKNFIANFSYIFMFGLFGTIISMLILSYIVISVNDYLFSNMEYRMFRLSDYECLLLCSILCASDSVAALTIIKKKDYPKLNSILFGEGIINDAVSILLFRAIEDLIRGKYLYWFDLF
jgi:NhaP-type Na+/H+ or K+/H+ antiporter